MIQREEETFNIPSRQPAMHKLSAVIARDGSDLISDYWFSIVGKSARVTELPTGTQFDIHVTYHATLSYIVARTPDPPGIINPWVVIACAVCPEAQISLYGWDTTQHPLPGIGEDAGKTLVLSYFNVWTNPAIVGSSDLAFTIYLVGSCSANLAPPGPDQLAQMPVQ